MSELSELYQQVILDHNKKPRNFRKLETANHSAEGFNPLCGDQLTVYLKLEDDAVKEISFRGLWMRDLQSGGQHDDAGGEGKEQSRKPSNSSASFTAW
mgnify:CR=1 FL=1